MSNLLPALRIWSVTSLLLIAARAQDPDPTLAPLRAMQRELAAARADLALLRTALHEPPVVSGNLGVAFTNEYLFRGIPLEDRGVIAQPWVELGFRLYDGEDFVRSVELTTGIWNSLHDGPTGGSGSIWYESDVYAGLSAGLGERWTVGATYTAYHSPNSSFTTVEELGCSAAFDDSDLWLPIALQPSLLFAFEVDGQTDAGRRLGTFAEFGLTPQIARGSGRTFAIEVSTPVRVGLSVNDYFEQPAGGGDEVFGYVDAGFVVTTTWRGLPNPGKPWTLEMGVHYLVLGDSNQARNGGDDSELVATLTVGTSF